MILEQETIPVSIHRVYDTTLSDAGSIFIGRTFKNQLSFPVRRYTVIQLLTSIAHFSTEPVAVRTNHHQVVIITNFICVGTFPQRPLKTTKVFIEERS